jgi:3-deoxy-manno-octulosonate cytidylyltransferase (CMP-KDO synthetase)
MQIVGVIPARYDSSRYPGKPLADIHGKPMIQHVYERSLRAARLDRLVVATDDSRIVKTVESFGGKALLTRSDHPSGTDRVAEVAHLLGLGEDDVLINIQGDEPLVEPVMIERLIEAMEQNWACPMATLAFVCENEEDYRSGNVVKVVVDESGRALYFSRSPIPLRREDSDEPLPFLKHLGFYGYRHSFLKTFTLLPPGKLESLEKLEQLRALEHGYAIQVALSPVETHGVDTPEDLERLMSYF